MLSPIAEDIWGFHQDFRLPGGMRMDTRTTIVRLPSERLVVHAPLDIDDALARKIDELGEVAFIVAPSCLHHVYVKAAADRWSSSRVYGPPGLEAKQPTLKFERLPPSGTPTPWESDLRVRLIEGT